MMMERGRLSVAVGKALYELAAAIDLMNKKVLLLPSSVLCRGDLRFVRYTQKLAQVITLPNIFYFVPFTS
jgi:hypothetical protein